MKRILEIGGRRLPFLRWSAVRMFATAKRMGDTWQVGDGREQALCDHVLAHARAGDIDDAIRVIDDFCAKRSFMMNVGDEKGALLDRAIERADPRLLLELGTYCGYSGLRIARTLAPEARMVSLEFSAANAEIAQRIWDHAGVGDRLTLVVGSLGDGGATIERLRREHGFDDGALDFVFVDHDKDAYLADLQRIVEQRWLRPGSVVLADNVGFPGAPDYREHMRAAQDRRWQTVEHKAHLEYQSLIRDLVLESRYLGEPA